MMETAFSPSLEILPKNFPTRRTAVENWGEFIVPRHIVRIDCYPLGRSSQSHGWQVRYRGETKFFTDSPKSDRYRRLRSALENSLEMATAYLAKIYNGQAVPLRKKESDKKIYATGVPGIRVVWVLNARDFEEVYIEVSHMTSKLPAKRFYVGTCNTATNERMAEKMICARAYRNKIIAEHMSLRFDQSMNQGVFCRTKAAQPGPSLAP